MAVQAHQWGDTHHGARAARGHPPPTGKGDGSVTATRLCSPMESCRRRSGKGQTLKEKKGLFRGSIPCSLPVQSVLGFQGQGYIKSDLASLWALQALIQRLRKQIPASCAIFCCLPVPVTGGPWPPPPSANLSCTDPEKPEGKG